MDGYQTQSFEICTVTMTISPYQLALVIHRPLMDITHTILVVIEEDQPMGGGRSTCH